MIVKPLNQRDARWSRVKLGFSNLTIGGYGCTLVSLTMLLNYIERKSYTPDQVNARLKEKGAFVGALMNWSRVSLAYPSLRFVERGRNYSNLKVSSYVYIRKLPVMVEVDGESIGAGHHWVLFIGDRKMNDPWTGKTESTSKYPCTGYSLFQKG